MTETLTAYPIEEADIPVFASIAEASASGRLARVSLGAHQGFLKPGDAVGREEFAYVIPGGRLVVLDDVCVALTSDGGFLPASFPKDWPYARYRDGANLVLPIARRHRAPGVWACPFTQSHQSHLFHTLFDNYGRMAWLHRLEAARRILFPMTWPLSAGKEALARPFFDQAKRHFIDAGEHSCDSLIIPPPGNRNDRFYPIVAEFLRNVLLSAFVGERFQHPTRLFVSRADAKIRNVANEPDLIEALKPLGFMAICPGDYSIPAQFELFAAAQTVVAVHGNGLTPMLTARDCQRLVEIEPLGWPGSPFAALAGALGLDYQRVGGELLPREKQSESDWWARVKVADVLEALQT